MFSCVSCCFFTENVCISWLGLFLSWFLRLYWILLFKSFRHFSVYSPVFPEICQWWRRFRSKCIDTHKFRYFTLETNYSVSNVLVFDSVACSFAQFTKPETNLTVYGRKFLQPLQRKKPKSATIQLVISSDSRGDNNPFKLASLLFIRIGISSDE